MTCDHHGRVWASRHQEDWSRDLPAAFRSEAEPPCSFERHEDDSGAWRIVGRDAGGEICYQRSVYAIELVHATDEYEAELAPEYVCLGWSWRLRGGRWLSMQREKRGPGDCRRTPPQYLITPRLPR